MINSVSSVSFKSNPQVTQDPISRIGAYTKQPETVVPKKKGKFWKKAAIVIASAAAVAAGLIVAARRGWVKPLQEGVANAKLMEKVSDKLYKAGDWLDSSVWGKIVNVFKKEKPEKINLEA